MIDLVIGFLERHLIDAILRASDRQRDGFVSVVGFGQADTSTFRRRRTATPSVQLQADECVLIDFSFIRGLFQGLAHSRG